MNTLLQSRPRTVQGSSYASLRERVRQTLLDGQQKIEQQKVLTYWRAGKLIKEHLLLNKERADLGQRVIQKLAEDLDIDESNLWKILKFARAFPVLDARPELTWAHYRTAMRVPDEKKRLRLLEQAAEGDWPSRKLEIAVRNHHWSERVSKDGKINAPRLPMVCLGPFYTYKIIRPEAIHSEAKELLLDLGFSHALELSLWPQAHFPAETIVASIKDARGRSSLEKVSPSASLTTHDDILYTYKAFVEKVLDGDTLKVEFQLGFGNRQRETIRLNAIDCPEMDTPEGKAAKRFVESQLSGCEFITVKSVKTRKEKWGRYLGDVFFQKKGSGSRIYKPVGNDKISTGSTQATRLEYLNQLLLDKGHAVRVRM